MHESEKNNLISFPSVKTLLSINGEHDWTVDKENEDKSRNAIKIKLILQFSLAGVDYSSAFIKVCLV